MFHFVGLPAPVRAARRWKRPLTALLLCLLAMLAIHVWHITLGGNFHTVIPGQVYRSGQPSAADVQQLARDYGIRTIINLRGDNSDLWYYEEHERAEQLGVAVIDVGLWAQQAPPTDQFRLLVEALAEAPGAILVHCNSGSDRSGLASALALLLRSDVTVAEARRQFSVYYGHNPFGRAKCLQQIFDRYEQWLAARGWEHRPERLREWARTAYSAD
jgi:protein tyrosine/serine phosphatase